NVTGVQTCALPISVAADDGAASTWISEYPGCHWGTSTLAISITGSGLMRRVTSARMLWGKSFWFVFGVLTGRGTVSPRLAVRQARPGRLACRTPGVRAENGPSNSPLANKKSRLYVVPRLFLCP